MNISNTASERERAYLKFRLKHGAKGAESAIKKKHLAGRRS